MLPGLHGGSADADHAIRCFPDGSNIAGGRDEQADESQKDKSHQEGVLRDALSVLASGQTDFWPQPHGRHY